MKTIRFTFLWLLLMAVAPTMAQGRYIYAEPVTIEAGGEGEIIVNMDLETSEKVLYWSFKLTLPEGIQLVNAKKPKKSVTISEGLFDDTELAQECTKVLKENENSFIVNWSCILYLTQRRPMKSTQGELMRIAVRSTLDKAVTVEPEVSEVSMENTLDEPLVVDGVLVPRDNTLYVEDFTAMVGTEMQLSVKLRNTVDVEGFAFDLCMPMGMTVVTDADGTPMVSLSEERADARFYDNLEVVRLGTNTLRVVVPSSNGAVIKTGYGEVCTVRVKTDKTIEEIDNPLWGKGICRLQLKNISVSDSETQSYDVPWTTAVVTVKTPQPNGAIGTDYEGESTGIEEKAMTAKAKTGKAYDLQGRPVQNGKGLILRDGRKYIGK